LDERVVVEVLRIAHEDIGEPVDRSAAPGAVELGKKVDGVDQLRPDRVVLLTAATASAKSKHVSFVMMLYCTFFCAASNNPRASSSASTVASAFVSFFWASLPKQAARSSLDDAAMHVETTGSAAVDAASVDATLPSAAAEHAGPAIDPRAITAIASQHEDAPFMTSSKTRAQPLEARAARPGSRVQLRSRRSGRIGIP
jgi:hypothetical protein